MNVYVFTEGQWADYEGGGATLIAVYASLEKAICGLNEYMKANYPKKKLPKTPEPVDGVWTWDLPCVGGEWTMNITEMPVN